MNRNLCIGAVLAIAMVLGGCGRDPPRYPRTALEACRAPAAVLALRRAVLREAERQGAPAALTARIRRDAHAMIADPQVRNYDEDTGAVRCSALLRFDLGFSSSDVYSTVAYQAEPRHGGYRYRLSDPGQIVSEIASLGPPPPQPEPEPPSASSAGTDATVLTGSSAPPENPQVLQDAAAAGDTGRIQPPSQPPQR